MIPLTQIRIDTDNINNAIYSKWPKGHFLVPNLTNKIVLVIIMIIFLIYYKSYLMKRAKLILSTDTLSWYGLDLVFQIAQKTWYDGIDLALWKNFDSRNVNYVKQLQDKYELCVCAIQVSSNPNIKEMNIAIDLARALWCDTISINSPNIFNVKSYNFLSDNLSEYRTENPNIKFTIINPPKENLFLLPISKYRFSNIIDIIKVHHSYLGMDISHIDESTTENELIKKLPSLVPYMSIVYLSDRSKNGAWHLPLWDGELKLSPILKKLKQLDFEGYIAIKLQLDKVDLADQTRVEDILQKCKNYYTEHYKNIAVE